MQGDRVQSEYYHQFADHYFRVLNESRVRFEEQRKQRDDYYDEEEGEDEAVSAEAEDGDERDGGDERPERFERPRREYREERSAEGYPDRNNSERHSADRGNSDRNTADRGSSDRNASDRNGERRFDRPRPRRDERPDRGARDEAPAPAAEGTIALDVLPPAIASMDGEGPAKAPRRRTRRPRGDDEADIAPAA
jgi:hypothetical protein